MTAEDESLPDAISAPIFEPGDQRYQSDCNDALRGQMERLCKAAVVAGWEERAATYALMVLAAERLKRLSDPAERGRNHGRDSDQDDPDERS